MSRSLPAGLIVASQYLRQSRTRAFGCDGETVGIDSHGVERHGNQVPRTSNHTGGAVDLAALVSNHGRSVAMIQSETDGDLDDVVPHNSLQALPFRNVVPLELVFRGVDPIVAEKGVDVEEVEEASGDGVDDCR